MFKGEVAKLLPRLRKLKHKDTELEFAAYNALSDSSFNKGGMSPHRVFTMYETTPIF